MFSLKFALRKLFSEMNENVIFIVGMLFDYSGSKPGREGAVTVGHNDQKALWVKNSPIPSSKAGYGPGY